ncbi:hypothetical protein HYH03_018678 [Edaphochlamys debaryana]|uniref:Uncharacterized protein n=1 Tax=Edaphochlamys debaryana TaxID=47281 RepID=A0A836BN26_9CHLO|nr:hypothetical protein HYH03_018678 [Edaphochlamys debaryana]|eukprot:KAG2482382.1 hypothetical protein HYH03_018678 [Edaphochlamys debaryana]
MYYRRVMLRPRGTGPGSIGATGPFGTTSTWLRGSVGRMLLGSLPLLFVLSALGPSDVPLGVPHSQGHPVTALPEEAMRHVTVTPSLTEGAAPAGTTGPSGPDTADAETYPTGLRQHLFPHWGGRRGAAPPPAAAPPPSSVPLSAADLDQPLPYTFGQEISEELPSGGPREAGAAGTTRGAVPPPARVQGAGPGAAPQALDGAPGGGEAHDEAERAGPLAPPAPGAQHKTEAGTSLSDLQSCSITAVAAPVVQALTEQAMSAGRDLRAASEARGRAQEAAAALQRQLAATREAVREVDAERSAAAARGDYAAAAVARARLDELGWRAGALEAGTREAQDQADALAAVEAAVRQEQLMERGAELRALSAAAAAAIARLAAEMEALQERVETAAQARTMLGQALSAQSQALALRRELRALAGAAQAQEARAAEQLAANRAVLSDAAALASNLSSAAALARAAALEGALLRAQRELAEGMQDYEHAERLSSAASALEGAAAAAGGSEGSFRRLLAAHQAVMRQRLSDFLRVSARAERAAGLVLHVRDLRDMYGRGQLEDAEALELAAGLGAAVGELAAEAEGEAGGGGAAGGPGAGEAEAEAEAAVRQLLE